MKANRNKTIDFSIEEGQKYLDRCFTVSKNITLPEILDKTILGDSFQVLDKLPPESVDLLIVDPCYNLDKNFHGIKLQK